MRAKFRQKRTKKVSVKAQTDKQTHRVTKVILPSGPMVFTFYLLYLVFKC